MKNHLCIVLAFLVLTGSVHAATEQEMITASRQSIKTFAAQLKNKLQHAMKQGGPVQAIQVCRTAAAEISQQVSDQYGWKIARTSLKVRNPANAPDPWEKQVLQDFATRRARGEDLNSMEHSEIIRSTENTTFRYMKAIPTADMCVMCHGENIAANIAEKLQEFYPDDQARGFKAGNLRGAFTITRNIE